HQRLRPREIHRSLGMGNPASNACKEQGCQSWPHDMNCAAKFLFGEVFCPPLGREIGRPIERLFQSECTAYSEHLCTSADLVLSARRKTKGSSRERPMTF